MDGDPLEQFAAFARSRSQALRRTAFLLTLLGLKANEFCLLRPGSWRRRRIWGGRVGAASHQRAGLRGAAAR